MICNQGVYDPDFVFVAPRITWTSDPNWLEDEFEMAATDRKIDIGVLDLFQSRDGMLIELQLRRRPRHSSLFPCVPKHPAAGLAGRVLRGQLGAD